MKRIAHGRAHWVIQKIVVSVKVFIIHPVGLVQSEIKHTASPGAARHDQHRRAVPRISQLAIPLSTTVHLHKLLALSVQIRHFIRREVVSVLGQVGVTGIHKLKIRRARRVVPRVVLRPLGVLRYAYIRAAGCTGIRAYISAVIRACIRVVCVVVRGDICAGIRAGIFTIVRSCADIRSRADAGPGGVIRHVEPERKAHGDVFNIVILAVEIYAARRVHVRRLCG